MEEKKQEDLDMIYLINSIKKFFIGIIRSIQWVLDLSIKKFKQLSLFLLVSIGLGYLLFNSQKPFYTSELSVSHIRLENDYCQQMIDNLNSLLIGTSDRTNLSSALSLSVENAKEIKKISYVPLNSNISEKFADSINVLLPFKVVVEVYSNDVLDTLQNRLMGYLENNTYANRRKQIELNSLLKTENRIEEEILETDSLKNLVNQGIVPRGSGNGIILGEPIDPIGVYKRGLELYERELLLKKKQILNNSFELMVGFAKKPKPSNPGLIFYVSICLLFGYVIGIIWISKKEMRKKA